MDRQALGRVDAPSARLRQRSAVSRLCHLARLAAITGVWVVTGAQAQVGRAPPPSARARDAAVQSARAAGDTAIDVAGNWHGYLSSPSDSSAAQWEESFSFTQSGNSVSGNRKTVALGASKQFIWSEAGTLSGTNLILQDTALVSSVGSTTPCKVTLNLTVSADGSSFSGTWEAPQQSGCASGTIYANKYGGSLAKRLGSGVPCDGGLGSSTPSASSGQATNANGQSCAEQDGALVAGDPIDASTGNFFLQEDDYAANEWLKVTRFYNSLPGGAPGTMGFNWRHNYERALQLVGQPVSTIILLRPDGKQETFAKTAGGWVADTPVDVLTEITDGAGSVTGYRAFIGGVQQTEEYSADGKLTRVTDQTGFGVTLTYTPASTSSGAPPAGLLSTVTDSFGRVLKYSYDRSTARLNYVTLPNGQGLSYSYDAKSANLTRVYYPDYDSRAYAYNEAGYVGNVALPNAMTGIVDGKNRRYESITYDDLGRATMSAFANGVGMTKFAYNADGSVDLTYPLGNTVHVGMTSTATGQGRVGTLSAPCAPDCGQLWKTRTYDAFGMPASAVDFNGVATTTRYNALRLLEQTVEAVGTDSERTTTTTWDAALRQPLKEVISGPNAVVLKQTSWVYDAAGRTLAVCEADGNVAGAADYPCALTDVAPAGVRRTRYSYCTAVDATQCPRVGLLLSVTGPRSDLSDKVSFAYYVSDSNFYKAGDLKTSTNALGQVTTFDRYSASGQPIRVIDPNGTIRELSYDARERPTSQTIRAMTDGSSNTNDAIRSVSYQYGLVQTVRDPDGVSQTFVYDDAHRITDITFGGGRVHYDYDNANHRIRTQVLSSNGVVVKSTGQSFDALGRLVEETDGLGQSVYQAKFADSFDGNGNVLHASTAWNQYRRVYDAFNRVVSSTDGVGASDPGSKDRLSVFTYDAVGGVSGVSDPAGLTTTYVRSGFGQVSAVNSPDAGDSSVVYDEAGQVVSQRDAKGQTASFTYDALGRRTSATFANAADNIAWFYDEDNAATGCVSSAPVGQLTRVVQVNLTTVYCYDRRGNVIQKIQTQGTSVDRVAYTYTPADRLASVSVNGAITLNYARDYNGNISALSLAGSNASTDLVRGATYLPLGPVASYSLGSGPTIALSYDANFRVTDIASTPYNFHARRDSAGRLAAIGQATGAPVPDETYGYDGAGRLASVAGPSGTLESYAYNTSGDRVSKTGAGLATGTYGYAPNSHRLTSTGTASRSYDANGALTSLNSGGESWDLSYDAQGRLTEVKRGGAIVGTYRYNVAGQRVQKDAAGVQTRFVYGEDGLLLAEIGATTRVYARLNDRLVATVDRTAGATTVGRVYTDDLGAPRVVTDDNQAVLWSWARTANPFGEGRPVAKAVYVLNERFAGQYADSESGFYYNNARYYDPTVGRYLSSDPLGLNAGLNTYAYVGSLPLDLTDPTGYCAKNPNNPKCKLPIMQPAITKVFGSMGKELGIDPLFVMSSALQESGWDMKHVYETNAKSGGKPLNNLFGMTRAGKSNLAYPSLDAAADAWIANWGSYLAGKPQTIQDYAKALTSTPGHQYNASPKYPGELAARYKQLVSATADCGTTF